MYLFQSNEVGSSYHMEKEGLVRSLNKLEEHLDVHTLVTDRHVSINKMMNDHYGHINHMFDIWHVAKSE